MFEFYNLSKKIIYDNMCRVNIAFERKDPRRIDFDTFIGIMNSAFKRNIIKFHAPEVETRGEQGYEYFETALIDNEGLILLFIKECAHKQALKSFAMGRFLDFDRNPLLQEMRAHIGHELVHRNQKVRSANKVTFDSGMSGFDDYYSDPHEINARVYDTVTEFCQYNISKTHDLYTTYFKHDSKVYKRYMKKLCTLVQKERKII